MANKQIQVSSVKQMADVEVIFVNASIISKAIRSSMVAHNVLDKYVYFETVPECDEDGTPKRDEKTGEVIATGKTIKRYDPYGLDERDLKSICETVLPFLDELCAALEG